MNTTLLYTAAGLLVFLGIAHSVLGERYILTRLFRRGQLPPLFGGTEFTERTLRFAWHLTTLAWFGFAALLVLLADPPLLDGHAGLVIGATFVLHGLVALLASRGRHLAWPVFLSAGVLTIVATRG